MLPEARLVALIEDSAVVRRILTRLGLPTVVPLPAPAVVHTPPRPRRRCMPRALEGAPRRASAPHRRVRAAVVVPVCLLWARPTARGSGGASTSDNGASVTQR